MALAFKHLAVIFQDKLLRTRRATPRGPAQRQGGWMPKLFAASSSRESFFS